MESHLVLVMENKKSRLKIYEKGSGIKKIDLVLNDDQLINLIADAAMTLSLRRIYAV